MVFDDAGRVLLGQRADNGRLGADYRHPGTGGGARPGLVREIFEETGGGGRGRAPGLGGTPSGPVSYPNGDVCDFLTIVFRCRYVSGEARVNDDESLAVGWFAREDFPTSAGPP